MDVIYILDMDRFTYNINVYQKKKKKKKLYFVMVTMSRLNRDFQWAIRDKQSLLRARFLHLIMKHAWSGNRTTDQRHAKRM